jgi:hypothetical protein
LTNECEGVRTPEEVLGVSWRSPYGCPVQDIYIYRNVFRPDLVKRSPLGANKPRALLLITCATATEDSVYVIN